MQASAASRLSCRPSSHASVPHQPMNACRAPGQPIARARQGSWTNRFPGPSRPGSYCTACQAIKARWCLDARYGFKTEVTNLLVEWVQTIGAAAGLNSSDVHVSSGAIGCPESRLELEVTLDSLTDWEAFLSRIPPHQHKAWSQRMQGMVVDASPTWHVYRVVSVTDLPDAPRAATASKLLSAPSTTPAAASWPAAADSRQAAGSSLYLPPADLGVQDLDDLIKAQGRLSQQLGSGAAPSYPGSYTPEAPAPAAAATGDDDDDGEVVLDWKGDPMKIRKGDRMPKFL